MTASEDQQAVLRAALQGAWHTAGQALAPHGEDGQDIIQPIVDAALALRQLEHEADLDRARLTSYRIGVLTVVETFRKRLMATSGVPSRTALLAFIRTMERDEGGKV